MKNHKSKGDRLNWTPLKDVKPVKLNDDLTRGKRVDRSSSSSRSQQTSHKRTLLVP